MSSQDDGRRSVKTRGCGGSSIGKRAGARAEAAAAVRKQVFARFIADKMTHSSELV